MMIKKSLATGGLAAVLVGGTAGAGAATYHPASAATTAAAVQHLRATGPSQAKEARAKRRGHLARDRRPRRPPGRQRAEYRPPVRRREVNRGWCPPGRMNAPGGHRPGAPDGRRLHRGLVLRRSGRRITSVINGAMTSRVLRDTRPACAWRLRRVQGHREQPPRGRTGKNYCRQAP